MEPKIEDWTGKELSSAYCLSIEDERTRFLLKFQKRILKEFRIHQTRGLLQLLEVNLENAEIIVLESVTSDRKWILENRAIELIDEYKKENEGFSIVKKRKSIYDKTAGVLHSYFSLSEWEELKIRIDEDPNFLDALFESMAAREE